MPFSSEKQQVALNYLKENIEFFGAALWNQYLFKKWAKGQNIIVEFSKCLSAVIDDIAEYKAALIGKGNLDRHNSLLFGTEERIKNLLINNPKLVNVLFEFSKNNNIASTWDGFYKRNPGIIPKRKIYHEQQTIHKKLALLKEKEESRSEKSISSKHQSQILATLNTLSTNDDSNLSRLTAIPQRSASAIAASSNPHALSKPSEKLSTAGLKQICKIFSTYTGDEEEKFLGVILVFENEESALNFREALWKKFELEKIHSVNIHYFESFSKALYPTECMFEVVGMANGGADKAISANPNRKGSILLSELAKIAEIENIPQVDTNYRCDPNIEVSGSEVPASGNPLDPNNGSGKVSAKGLKQICKKLGKFNLNSQEFYEIILVFENKKTALAFRAALWCKFEFEKIHSINIHYDYGFLNKEIYPTEFIFRVVMMANSKAYFESSKNYTQSGEIMLAELDKIVDIENVPQIYTNYKNYPIADSELPNNFKINSNRPII